MTRPSLAALALVLLLAAGCANRYVITLTNGTRVVTASKPRLVDSRYVYKDANGQEVSINAMRVRLIEPYSREAARPQLMVPEIQ